MLLKGTDKARSLKKGAEQAGVSYRTALNYVSRIEKNLGAKIIKTHRGGKGAGGYSVLTPAGRDLLLQYERLAGSR